MGAPCRLTGMVCGEKATKDDSTSPTQSQKVRLNMKLSNMHSFQF